MRAVVQRVKEAEKNLINDEFGDKQDELLIGTVALEDTDNYFIDLGRTNGILPKKDIIPGDTVKKGMPYVTISALITVVIISNAKSSRECTT